MTFPHAVTKVSALPARQGSLEVCADSATIPPASHRLTTWALPGTPSLRFPAIRQCSKPSRSDLTTAFPMPQFPTAAKQTPIKNQHCGAV